METGNGVEMFYLNSIEQLFLFVEQLDQLEVCLPYSRLLAGIPIQCGLMYGPTYKSVNKYQTLV